jgi:FkbH-like protein
MLAICSKNNEEDVLEVFDNHPDMILKRKHFLITKINWNNKADNIRQIAEELNIGLDSIVFIDDSSFEVNLVRKFLPQVETIGLPSDPSHLSDVLFSSGLFDTLSFSEEDKKRNKMYRADLKRKKAASAIAFKDLEEYYRYLEMEITLKEGDAFTIPRISQMTQKTNQFNLTTRRYSEGEIERFCTDEESSVRCLNLKDRFGDMGIVGVVILKYREGHCLIDTLLLSCRALGRGVEDVLLKGCVEMAKGKGCTELTGIYIPTPKNGQVEHFYEAKGFEFLENKEGGAYYRYSLREKSLGCPDYFKSIQTD